MRAAVLKLGRVTRTVCSLKLPHYVRLAQACICGRLVSPQVSHIIEACCGFLEKQLEPSNCIGIGDFALQHGCSQLYLKVNEFIDQNFPAVSGAPSLGLLL